MADTKIEKKKSKAAISDFFKKAGKFFRDVKGELKKIVWPTVPTVFRNMGVVLVAVAAVTIFVFALDTAFMNLLGLVMDIAR